MTACFIPHEKGPFLYVDMMARRSEGLPAPEMLGHIGTFESRGLAELEVEKRLAEDNDLVLLVRAKRCYQGTPEAYVGHEVYAYRIEDFGFEQLSTKNLREGYVFYRKGERFEVGVDNSNDAVCVHRRCIDLGEARLPRDPNLVLRPQPSPPRGR